MAVSGVEASLGPVSASLLAKAHPNTLPKARKGGVPGPSWTLPQKLASKPPCRPTIPPPPENDGECVGPPWNPGVNENHDLSQWFRQFKIIVEKRVLEWRSVFSSGEAVEKLFLEWRSGFANAKS